MNRSERRELAAEIRRITGRKVREFTYPGGESRESIRAELADASRVIVTRRPSGKRAGREVSVLRNLNAGGAPVPRVIHSSEGLLLQEDLGDLRLSEALHADHKPDIAALLDAALDGLATCQEAATERPIEGLPTIGDNPNWCGAFARTPDEVSKHTERPVPEYDADAVAALLAVGTPRFVKWDSRPGNALVPENRPVHWFDWEHCGLRNGVDDVVWLMADEFVTFDADMERTLLDRHLPRFAPDQSPDEAERYLRVMGVFHTCVRLELALRYRLESDGWWSLRKCLAGDKVGVVRRCCRRMVWRAAHWADHDPLTRPLADWFREVEEVVETL